MKRRIVLPAPVLEIPEDWRGAMSLRWRTRYGQGWAYAAWWLTGHSWFSLGRRQMMTRTAAEAWGHMSAYSEWHG